MKKKIATTLFLINILSIHHYAFSAGQGNVVERPGLEAKDDVKVKLAEAKQWLQPDFKQYTTETISSKSLSGEKSCVTNIGAPNSDSKFPKPLGQPETIIITGDIMNICK